METNVMNDNVRSTPDPVASRRATAGSFLRFIYASLVVSLGALLGWLLIKPLIYTQSTGSVVAPFYVVSTPFTARIVELSVLPGQSVKQGQVVATVRSPEIDALRVNLLRGIADQFNKIADLRIRLIVAKASLDSARKRVAAATESSTVIEENSGQVTSVFRAQILREYAQAASELAQIEAEIAETKNQIETIQQVKNDIDHVRQLVDTAFNDGKQLAPVDGVVANKAAKPGQSVTAGTSIVEIYDPTKLYIQWILDANRLAQPNIGAPVYVLDGNRIMRATVTEVYSISEQAQRGTTVFSRTRSGQLVRIELDDNQTYPAYMTDVEVRYNYWRIMDRLVDLYVDMMTALGWFWRER
jgi:HlyD family secretion protein